MFHWGNESADPPGLAVSFFSRLQGWLKTIAFMEVHLISERAILERPGDEIDQKDRRPDEINC